MSKTTPDWHDADLVLRLDDLRRETVMRASRDAMNARFRPRNYEDFIAITKPDHPDNAAVRDYAAFGAILGVTNADRTLMAGFTTIRNVGSGDFDDMALRKAVTDGFV